MRGLLYVSFVFLSPVERRVLGERVEHEPDYREADNEYRC